MTTEPRASLVEVEQVDRDAAYPYRGTMMASDCGPDLWNSGLYDGEALMQSFARHRLEALRTQGDGEWVLVPRVPTEAMMSALAHQAQRPTGWHDVYPAMYRALLAAAPTQASSRKEGE